MNNIFTWYRFHKSGGKEYFVLSVELCLYGGSLQYIPQPEIAMLWFRYSEKEGGAKEDFYIKEF